MPHAAFTDDKVDGRKSTVAPSVRRILRAADIPGAPNDSSKRGPSPAPPPPTAATRFPQYYLALAVLLFFYVSIVLQHLTWPLHELWVTNLCELVVASSIITAGCTLLATATLDTVADDPRLPRATLLFILSLDVGLFYDFLASPPPLQPVLTLYAYVTIALIATSSPALSDAVKTRVLAVNACAHFAAALLIHAFRTAERAAGGAILTVPLYAALPHVPAAGLDSRRFATALDAVVAAQPHAPPLTAAHLATHLAVAVILHAALAGEHLSRTHRGALAASFPRLSLLAGRARQGLQRAVFPPRVGVAQRVFGAVHYSYALCWIAWALAHGRYGVGGRVVAAAAHCLLLMVGCALGAMRESTIRKWACSARAFVRRARCATKFSDSVELLRRVPSLDTGALHEGLWEDISVNVRVVPLVLRPTLEEALSLRARLGLSVRLRHPHIITTYASFLTEQDPAAAATAPECDLVVVMVTEAGTIGSLANDRGLLRGGRSAPGPPDLLRIATVLRGLAAALVFLRHSRVVHGDLHPGAVLLLPFDGGAFEPGFTAKLADFWQARQLGAAMHVPVSGHQLGSPAYAPPELLAASPCVTVTSDIYSFGLLLWSLFAQRPPLAGLSPSQLRSMDRSPEAMRVALPDPAAMPPALAAVMRSCLQPHYAARLTADELLECVRRATAALLP